jgi:eukaryotic-like serine/threonine-protein kinase
MMASQNAADANLLFGILALQLDFIGRDHLIEAMNSWVLNKSRSLGEILEQRGALAPEERSLLDAMVAKHVERHGGDPAQSLEALSVAAGTQTLRQVNDDDLQRSLDRVACLDTDPAATVTYPVSASPARHGRFRILRPHARGGLGAVYVALDSELNREVALKEILPERSDDDASRARFVIEAEITGGLEHPGIVPVYSLGRHGDGRPFYAMRFIQGDSLLTAVDRFRLDHRANEPAREFQKLLRRFLDVCDAIEYAHSRGVLHRDIKPSNILLGRFGETIVVDWGLAKAEGGPSAADLAAEAPLVPSASEGVVETAAGAAVGTPAYMSPEQAAGRLDILGPRSDVYSLGATLYYVLTGRAPFKDRDIGVVLAKVQRGEFPSPREIERSIPRALEAICLKAMSTRPADRYASPLELAGEIERWLADEPVSAYRDPIGARLARWGRRNQAWVAGALVFLVVLAAASLPMTLLYRQKSAALTSLAAAHAAEEAQGRRADAHNYLNSVALAGREVGVDNFVAAERLLAQCPTVLRGWEWGYLSRQIQRERRTLPGHAGGAMSVALSSDGNLAASVDRDGVLRGWDVADDRLLWFQVQADSQYDLAFRPDGRQLATTGRGEIHLRDSKTGRVVRTLQGHSGVVNRLAYSPDGRWLASGGADRLVKVWDTGDGRELLTFPSHSGWIVGLAFSPDGRRIASAAGEPSERLKKGTAWSTEVKVWDAGTGRVLAQLNPIREGYVTALAFTTGGRVWVAGRGWPGVGIYDANTGQPVGLIPEPNEPMVVHLAVNRDGTRLVTASGWQWTPEQGALYPFTRRGVARVWDAATGRPIGSLAGHAELITALTFSGDGSRIASGCFDGSVRVWDATANQSSLSLSGNPDAVDVVTFSPNGRALASLGGGQFRLWDAGNGRLLASARAPTGATRAAVFSPDSLRVLGRDGILRNADTGQRISTLDDPRGDVWNDGTSQLHTQPTFSANAQRILTVQPSPAPAQSFFVVRQWDATTGRELSRLPLEGSIAGLFAPTFDRDARRVAAVVGWPRGQELLQEFRPHTIRVWDIESGRPVADTAGHWAMINALAFHPQGRELASGGIADFVATWDVETGRQIRRYRGRLGAVLRVAYSPNGRYLAAEGSERVLRVWDTSDGRELFALRTRGNAASLFHSLITFDSSGQRLITARMSGARLEPVMVGFDIWDTATGLGLLSLPLQPGNSPSERVALAPDDHRLAIADGKNIALWEVGAPPQRNPAPDDAWPPAAVENRPDGRILWGHQDGVESVAYRPGGVELASASRDGSVRVWNAATGAEIRRLHGLIAEGRGLAYRHDGRRLATIGSSGLLKCWDCETGRELTAFRAHVGPARALAFRPGGPIVATGGDDYAISLWNLETGQLARALKHHAGPITALAFSQDGSRLASTSEDRTVRLSDPTDGRLIRAFPLQSQPPTAVCFLADSTRVAASCDDGKVHIWDCSDGHEIRALGGPGGRLSALAISPDGRCIASGGENRLVRLWDTETGEVVANLSGPTRAIRGLAYSPDGSQLAAASADGTVQIWEGPEVHGVVR